MKTLSLFRLERSEQSVPWMTYAIEISVFALLLLVAIAINQRMIRQGFNGLGDARWHLTWIQHFSKQVLEEGIGYPRWLAGTNFGYGSPTFVFYPPFIYYLSTALKAFGLALEQTVYILISGGIFLSGTSFYIFGRSLWGRSPAAVGAIAYMASPGIYGLVHGGGFASLYAYVWTPLLLLFTHRSTEDNQHSGIYRLGLALVWTLVALTHLPSLLIFAIAWTFYTLPLLWQRPWKIQLQTWITAPLGWGLAAFFIIPAILEQRYINIDYMLASQDGFRAAMPKLLDIVSSGFSNIFLMQWIACIAFAVIAQIGFAKCPQKQRQAVILLAIALFIVFLICDWSWLLWQINPIVQKIELSARLDRLFYIAQAALCALAVQSVLLKESQRKRKSRLKQILLSTIICAILLGNLKYSYQLARQFPGLYTGGNGIIVNRPWIERIVRQPFSDQLIDVPEYRPRLRNGASAYIKEEQTSEGYPAIGATISGALPTPQPNQPRFEIAKGRADIEIVDWQSDRRRLTVDAAEPVTVILRTYTYPAWRLSVDQLDSPIDQASDGRIQFDLPSGRHDVALTYEPTLAFKLGLLASGSSAIAFAGLGYLWIIGEPNASRLQKKATLTD